MKARQAVLVEPFKVEIREVVLAAPAPNQILVECDASAIRRHGTGRLHGFPSVAQRSEDARLEVPVPAGLERTAGKVVAVGSDVPGWKPGDRVSYPGNHATHELLTIGHERGRLWKMPDNLAPEKAALACISRYGLGGILRAGLTLGRSVAVLGQGIIGQFALRCALAAGCNPVIGIDSVPMRREAASAAGADHVIDPAAGDAKKQLHAILDGRGAEVVIDATGVPDAIPVAMSLACDAGQVVVVGSPRGLARDVNFYEDLHRRYIEVSGAHGNMLFEPSHIRLAGAWDINKAQRWLLAALASGRLSTAKLVTHTIQPEGIGAAYEGLLKDKDNYLGVVVKWK